MAGSKADKDMYFGLTASQVRLILLGTLCVEDGKVDLDRLARKANLTSSSARSLYPKAMKQWRELNESDETPTAKNGTGAGNEEPPKKKARATKPRAPGTGPGRKRKRVQEEPVPEYENLENVFEDEPARPEAHPEVRREVRPEAQPPHEPELGFEPQDNEEAAVSDNEEHLDVEAQLSNTQSAGYDADADEA